MILDGGPCRVGVESTVLDLCAPRPRILRPGGLSREALEALIGPAAAGNDGGPADPRPPSPGQLDSHYAPRTGLTLLAPEEMAVLPFDPAGACLFFDGVSRDRWLAGPGRNAGAAAGKHSPRIRVLSETGDLREAAAGLFEILHELDGLGAARIYAEQVRPEGLGPAINDRLFRASAK
jgi:L-threonylcarbamoyladenylate synthase